MHAESQFIHKELRNCIFQGPIYSFSHFLSVGVGIKQAMVDEINYLAARAVLPVDHCAVLFFYQIA